MKKSAVTRVLGFIGALGASAALVGTAVNTTGAYFTDKHDGSINAGTGAVKVDTTDLTLNFDGLLPGEFKTRRVDYTARGTGAQDLWLVFPTTGAADAFLHTPQAGSAPLGRYGHLAITSNAGASFVSNNLTASPSGYNSADSCYIDANGDGGNAAELSSPSDLLPYCAPRPAILLQSNMSPGDTGYANIEFGFTKLLRGGQNSATAPLAAFSIVATQHGIRPDNSFN